MGNDPEPGTGVSFNPEEPAKAPQTNTISVDQAPTQNNQLVLTQEQFDQLISKLNQGSTMDKAPAPSMTPGVGLQVNPFGAVVGTVTKYNIDPEYYPNPVEALLDEPRLKRFSMRDNYFITWDITAKPYQTKDNVSIAEPTFHLTLYANEFDETGDMTERAIVIQTLHMNEDEELAMIFASENGVEVSTEGLRELMTATRYERSKRWLEDIFFPPRNFEMSQDAHEEAIGGSVVKVVTKSNVKGFGNKTPVIKDEELV